MQHVRFARDKPLTAAPLQEILAGPGEKQPKLPSWHQTLESNLRAQSVRLGDKLVPLWWEVLDAPALKMLSPDVDAAGFKLPWKDTAEEKS